MVRVHLINLRAESYPVTTAPLAIITLGAFLKSVFTETDVVYTDLQLSSLENELLPALEENPPDVVGVSAQYGSVNQLNRLLGRLEAVGWFGRACVVAGNVLPTYAYSHLLREYPRLLCCIGRGEIFLSKLVNQVSRGSVHPANLPGCAWAAADGRVEVSPANRFELELLPSADWRGLFEYYAVDRYDEIWVEASRGCPHKRGGVGCTYCAIMPDGGSRDWRPRSEDAVLREIEELASRGVTHIRFADEEWMADQPDRALAFAESLGAVRLRLASEGIQSPTFDLAMRVDDVVRRERRGANANLLVVDAHLDHKDNRTRIKALRQLRECGLTQVYLGVESGSAAQLRRYYKGVRPEDNSLALKVLNNLGIQAACGWIMFDPFVVPGEIQENVQFVRQNDLLPASPSDSFVTYPLNRMRPLVGSPSIEILRDAGLLGDRTANIVEFEACYRDEATRVIIEEVVEWEAGISRPVLYALKNRVARMAWEKGRLPPLDRALADVYFSLKRLDLDLADQLSRVAEGTWTASALRSVRLGLERHRSSLLTVAEEHMVREGNLAIPAATA